jgi:hypothetical protein
MPFSTFMHKSNGRSILQSSVRDGRIGFIVSRVEGLRSLLPARLTRLSATTWTRPELYSWAGLIAIALGLHAQQLLIGLTPSITDSTRWYSLAIGVLIAGWWGSYTNQSLLASSIDRSTRLGDLRLGIASRSVALNVASLFLIFSPGPSVALGVVAWFTSLGLFLYACRTRAAQ